MTSAPDDSVRYALFFELAGRCLLRYQRIEHALKILLPFMARQGSDLETFSPDWDEFSGAKHTLGMLFERWKERTAAEPPELSEQLLDRIIGERNDLVHLFLVSSRATSGIPGTIELATAELERRLENARPLEEGLSLLVCSALQEIERVRS